MSEQQYAERRRGARTSAPEHTGGGLSGAAERIEALQASAGNAAVGQMLQTKAVVGAASDRLEREADTAGAHAAAALRSDGAVTPASVSTVGQAVLRRTDGGGAGVGLDGGPAPASVDAVTGTGQPLSASVQQRMGPALGADLSGVRVHTGESSDRAATDLGAVAWTRGNDVHFAKGQYRPDSAAGQELLGHELAHTVQQGGGAGQVGRQVVQRMPSPTAVRSRTQKTEKKNNVFGRGGTTSYTALMDAIRKHSDWIVKRHIEVDNVEAQRDVICRMVDDVTAAALGYLAKKDQEPAVAELCNELVELAPLEKYVVKTVAAKWKANPFRFGPSNRNDAQFMPKWFSQLPSDPRTADLFGDRTANTFTATGGKNAGAQKEVLYGKNQDDAQGVFMEEVVEDDNARYMLEMYGGPKDEALNLANRQIASYRLDRLLKAGVTARTERGLHGDKSGLFMWSATGPDGTGKAMKQAIADGDSIDDDNLPRLLSRLQLVDTIAGQLDRHEGNYFIHRDAGGKVDAVTGIDLDMSWIANDPAAQREFDLDHGANRKEKVTAKNPHGRTRLDHFPGFSRFVDKEMAETILALDPDDLRAVLLGLLPAHLIEAAVTRLLGLQTRLATLRDNGELLDPGDWDAAVRAKIVSEGHAFESSEQTFKAKHIFGRAKRLQATGR